VAEIEQLTVIADRELGESSPEVCKKANEEKGKYSDRPDGRQSDDLGDDDKALECQSSNRVLH